MSVPRSSYEDPLLTTVRLRRERRTIGAMLQIWCAAHPLHVRTRSGPRCSGCERLLAYAGQRLVKCPFGEGKPTCKVCPIHCYTRDVREQLQEIMRFAGPRMLLHHPVLAIRHLLDDMKDVPVLKKPRPLGAA